MEQKRITFAPQLATVVATGLSRCDYTSDERENTWWSPKEVIQFRSTAKRVVFAFREKCQHLVTVIDDSYKLSQDHQQDNPANDCRVIQEEPYSKLFTWTSTNCGQRGLEKYISILQKNARPSAAREVRASVLDMERSGLTHEEIAKVYAEQSKASCLFALMMGQGDQVAVAPPVRLAKAA
jgi:hypothetical protein